MKDGRRVMKVDKGYLARHKLKRIMEEEGNRELYKRRKCTVEPVFGQIQEGMGFRRYFYRGRKKVRSEWNLVCAAFNIKKIGALQVASGAAAREREEHLRRNSTREGVWECFLREIAQYRHLLHSLISPIIWRIAPLPHCA